MTKPPYDRGNRIIPSVDRKAVFTHTLATHWPANGTNATKRSLSQSG